ncbi:ribosomal RNA small subunit methyltransferase I [Mycolicibacterium fallax]|nr:ribosomal RNA small subunit methyltransferase I [Mycolicibacterium fallax]
MGTARSGITELGAVIALDRRLSGMTAGRLLLGATPLGRPEDASARLREALASADVVAAEDTRRVRTLAGALDVRITGRVVSLFDQNEAARVPALIDDIAGGATVLAVSDAGMPLISDPGYRLVTAAVAAGLPVSCLPGPSAVTTALAVSGLPADRFCFEGFAPRRDGARRSWLATLAAEPRTVIFFESPRRLADCLRDAAEVLGGDRAAVVCRELTKTHEEVRRGGLAELAEWAADGVLGEITVVLAGATPVADLDTLVGEVLVLTDDGMGVKDACARVIAAHPGAPSRRELYQAVLAARD